MDDQGRVLDWLLDAHPQDEKHSVSKSGDSVDEPSTPTRQRPLVQHYNEISPTNTSFSCNSIFDAPELPEHSWIVDPFCDHASVATLDDERDSSSEIKFEQTSAKSDQIEIDQDGCDVASPKSLDPLIAVTNDLNEDVGHLGVIQSAAEPVPVGLNRPRMTCITSCTQCVLADLPCSRTVPFCSRCKRNGHARVCLLHRQTFRDEIDRFDVLSRTIPVLLKLHGEDENIWAEKLELATEVCGSCGKCCNRLTTQ